MNDYLRLMYKDCKIDDKVFDLCNEVEDSLKERFQCIDEVAELYRKRVKSSEYRIQRREMMLPA